MPCGLAAGPRPVPGAAGASARSIGTQELANIVFNVGAQGRGVDSVEEVAMRHLFGRSLLAVAAQCADPSAVRHAAQAR